MVARKYWVSGIIRYPVIAPQGQIIATVVLAPVDGQGGKVEHHVMTEAELREYEEGKHYVVDVKPAT